MSISINYKPQLYTPSGNPITFVVSSTASLLGGFMCYVYDVASGTLITAPKMNIKPDGVGATSSMSVINLTTYLDTIVKYQVDNSTTPNVVVTNPLKKYNVTFVEKLYQSNTGTYVDGDSISLPVGQYVWSASMYSNTFRSFDYKNYLVGASQSNVKFLTNKPNSSTVYSDSVEYLYFFHDDTVSSLSAYISNYDKNGTFIDTRTISITQSSAGQMNRLNVSPRVINSIGLNLSTSSYYTITLVNSGIAKSETRIYNLDCDSQVTTNLIWVNQMGGIDSYRFVNPSGQMNITKSTIQKSPFNYYSTPNYYDDYRNGIYNTSEEIIDINNNITYTVFSKFLTDAESTWLSQLYKSKQVWVELSDHTLVPVMLDMNNADIQRVKTNPNGYATIKFKMRDNISPL